MRGFEIGTERIEIEAHDELDSTNSEARRLADTGRVDPLWITARRQTAGRGRRGREWQSETGNLAATLFATTDYSPAEAAELSFVTAIAVRAMAREFVPENIIKFKWPNDVLIDGQKLSGILIESGTRADGKLWLAIGVGVNLASAPLDVERPATCLADHLKAGIDRAPSARQALEVLSEKLTARISAWTRAGAQPFYETWTQSAHGLGETCIARLDTETVEGIAEGLDADGALRLRLPSGQVRRITAGDVFFGGAR